MPADPIQPLIDLMERERLTALALGQTLWGIVGDSRTDRRFAVPLLVGDRLCECGCQTRQTLSGMVNGMVMIRGCEFSVRRWVKNR